MTIKKRYSIDNAIFDFPIKSLKAGKTITRRPQSIVSRSMLSGRNVPIKPNFNFFAPKCFCNRNLYILLMPNSRSLWKSSSFNFIFKHTRENFVSLRYIFSTQSNLTQPKTKLPLLFSQVIRKEKGSPFFLSFFSEIEPLKMLKVQLESCKPVDKISDFSILLPVVAVEPIISNVFSEKLIQSFNFAEIFYFKVLPDNFASINLTLNKLKQNNINSKLILTLSPLNHFCLTYQTSIYQKSDSFIFLQRPTKHASTVKIVARCTNLFEFDNPPEIGKNLILEAKNQINCHFGAGTPIEQTRFLIRMTHNRRLDPDFICNSKIKLKTIGLRFDFRCLPKQRLYHECKFEKIFTADAEFHSFSRKILSLGDFSTRWHSLKPRLKLKLKKNLFIRSEPSMQMLVGKKIFIDKAFTKNLPTKQNFCFQRSKERVSEWNYQTKYLYQSTNRINFGCFRFPLLFITKKHAFSCLKLIQKIKSPTLPLKAAFKELKHQHLAAHFGIARPSSNVFMTNPGLFCDTVMILGRPALFLMSVTKLNFTDISLPNYQRKVKSPNGYFRFAASLLALKSLNCQMQRFLFSIKFKDNFKKLPGKRIRIKFIRRHLKLFKPASLTIKSIEKFLATSSSCPEKYFNHSLMIEKKLQIISGLPKAIVPILPLSLKLILPEKILVLQQRNIIPPPEWQKVESKFICRLRLLPYPFGFPGFSQPEFSMKCIGKLIRVEILSSQVKAIKAQAYNYSLNRKTYFSKYSLKKPERWLFPTIGQAVFKLFSVLPHYAAMPVDYLLKPLLAPNAFVFSWQKVLEKKLKFENYYFYQNKVFNNTVFAENTTFISKSWIEASLPIPLCKAKKISRLLLKQSKFTCRRAQKENAKAFLRIINRGNQTFKINEPQIIHSWSFLGRKISVLLEAKKILAFYFKFPASELIHKNKLINFKALFRQFHFPYTPGFSKISYKHLPYFELDDTSNLLAFAPGEEIRVSQIRDNGDLNSGHPIIRASLLISKHKFVFVHNFKREIKSAFNTHSHDEMQLLASNLKWQILSIPHQYPQLNDWQWHNKTVAKATIAKLCYSTLWHNKLDYIASSRLFNRFCSLNLVLPHWVILVKKFFGKGRMPEQWKFLSLLKKTRLQQFKTIYQIGSFKQLFFYDSLKQSALQVSLPDVSVFYTSVQKTLPKTEKQGISVLASLSTIRRIITGFSIEKKTLSSVKNPIFCQKSDSLLVKMSQIEKFNVYLKFNICRKINFSRKLKFVEFQMHSMIVKNAIETNLSCITLRLQRSNFRLNFIPDWIDLEMQRVDLNI